MAYILIIFLVGSNTLGGRALSQVEFPDQRSCEVAADLLSEIESRGMRIITACVPAGKP